MKKRLRAQGKPFTFTEENLAKAAVILDRYPVDRRRSALLPLLDLAQRQMGGWLSQEAIAYVSTYLGLPPLQGYEVASFYSMFNFAPVGRYFVQVCTTTPCQLRGAQDILEACQTYAQKYQRAGAGLEEDPDLFSVCEVECLGACVNGPVVQINDDYYEDLDRERITEVLHKLAHGQESAPGSQKGRQGSAPEGTESPVGTSAPRVLKRVSRKPVRLKNKDEDGNA